VVGWNVVGFSDGGGSSSVLPQCRCSRITGVRPAEERQNRERGPLSANERPFTLATAEDSLTRRVDTCAAHGLSTARLILSETTTQGMTNAGSTASLKSAPRLSAVGISQAMLHPNEP
jgi:hypothetical protein